jgi:hypothetical protein
LDPKKYEAEFSLGKLVESVYFLADIIPQALKWQRRKKILVFSRSCYT